MRNNSEEAPDKWGKLVMATAGAMAMFTAAVLSGPLKAQSTAPSAVPLWQIAAGGKILFDVASVKLDAAAPFGENVHSNVPLGPQDAFSPTGGLLSTINFPLLQYMIFAYKLTYIQVSTVRSQLPKWATSNRYDIEARAAGNPAKDQFRVMMQALLADRFKLTVHYETRQLPAYALVLDKPGKLGPQLKPHPANSDCPTLPPLADALAPTVAGGFPEPCGAITDVQPSAPGRLRVGARNMPVAMLADSLLAMGNYGNPGNLDRSILDSTGLAGKFDFVVEWAPQPNGPRPPGVTFQPDPTGPTFAEALKEQLGLKLESTKGPVDVLIIDHVEEPSAN